MEAVSAAKGVSKDYECLTQCNILVSFLINVQMYIIMTPNHKMKKKKDLETECTIMDFLGV